MSCSGSQRGSRSASRVNVSMPPAPAYNCRSNCTMCCPPPRRLPKCPEGIYVERVKSMKPDVQFVGSCAKFDGLTTYKEYYVPKCGPRAQSLKPAAQFYPSDAKLSGLTTYKEYYTRKPVYPYQKPEWSVKARFDPSCAPLEGISTYRKDYTGVRGELVKSLKPLSQFDPSCAPMEGITTYRKNYVAYCDRERGYAKQPSLKKLAGGDISCAPFDGISTYRGDYWKKPIIKVSSLKPTVRGAFSDAPFADRTTYRNDYVPFHFNRCPEPCIPAAVYNATCPPELFCCGPDPPEPKTDDYNPCPTPPCLPPPMPCPPVPPCPACPCPEVIDQGCKDTVPCCLPEGVSCP